jgi:hypothetical protein
MGSVCGRSYRCIRIISHASLVFIFRKSEGDVMNVWELKKVVEPELMKRLGKIIQNIETEYRCFSRV